MNSVDVADRYIWLQIKLTKRRPEKQKCVGVSRVQWGTNIARVKKHGYVGNLRLYKVKNLD